MWPQEKVSMTILIKVSANMMIVSVATANLLPSNNMKPEKATALTAKWATSISKNRLILLWKVARVSLKMLKLSRSLVNAIGWADNAGSMAFILRKHFCQQHIKN